MAYSQKVALVKSRPELYQAFVNSGLSMRDFLHGMREEFKATKIKD